MRASLVSRLRRLEVDLGGACPACAGQPYVTLRNDQPVPCCKACGQPVRR
jgi:hypothetical protein